MSTLNLGDSLILDTDYSESEVKTGATWIDGKPIYMRTFTGTTAAINTWLDVPISSNIDKVWIAGSYIASSNGWVYTIGASDTLVQIKPSTSIFEVRVSQSYLASQPFAVTLCYTKTTD